MKVNQQVNITFTEAEAIEALKEYSAKRGTVIQAQGKIKLNRGYRMPPGVAVSITFWPEEKE